MASVWVPPVEIAYYSMEIALEDALPTFSGGLGVLAGDHLRAAADRGLPVAAVTLLYNHGFFDQVVEGGAQREVPVDWDPSARLEDLGVGVWVAVAGRKVWVRVWRTTLVGVDGDRVAVHFLDTNVGENAEEDRDITDRLYPSDPYERLRQEAVLGLAGPLALEAAGHRSIRVHHLNEGHGSLVPVGLLARRMAAADPGCALAAGLNGSAAHEVASIRQSCVFTTHTPVPAGHDRFLPDVARAVLGDGLVDAIGGLGCLEADGSLNMTVLGLCFAGFVNGVSRKHAEVTRAMFPSQPVASVTNGVHTATWAAPATAEVFDRHLAGWRADSQLLRYAADIPLPELRAAHDANKRALCDAVRSRTGSVLRPDVLTVGIARRFAQYKRNDLIVSDMERLAAIAEAGPLQVVFAGKAHPMDNGAKDMLSRVVEVAGRSVPPVSVVFVPGYGMELGRLLCAGSDVWLNTPAPPNEASGTSGMKAAVNGVPSLSTLDGWWLEGWIDGVTGWAVGPAHRDGAPAHRDGAPAQLDGWAPGYDADAESLYRLLEEAVVPGYYKDPDGLMAIGRQAIALNGSFFSAHRMVDEYARRAYRERAAD